MSLALANIGIQILLCKVQGHISALSRYQNDIEFTDHFFTAAPRYPSTFAGMDPRIDKVGMADRYTIMMDGVPVSNSSECSNFQPSCVRHSCTGFNAA